MEDDLDAYGSAVIRFVAAEGAISYARCSFISRSAADGEGGRAPTPVPIKLRHLGLIKPEAAKKACQQPARTQWDAISGSRQHTKQMEAGAPRVSNGVECMANLGHDGNAPLMAACKRGAKAFPVRFTCRRRRSRCDGFRH